jgi:RNA polymerase sigma-54 factor
MRLDTMQHLRLDQRLILAPRMIQSMEILQLPIMALQERIQQELQENPVLELLEASDENSADPDFQPVAVEEVPTVNSNEELSIDENGTNEKDFERLETLNRDWEDHFNEEHRPSRNGIDEEGDRKHDAMQNMESRPQSLQDYLEEQLPFLEVTPEQRELIEYLIANLNENGYLATADYRPLALEDLALSHQPPTSVEHLEEALGFVQQLDPPGVGARDLKECLLLQLLPDMPHREILRVLIQNHLEDIKHNRLPAIQRRTGFDLNAIKEAIEALRRLNPRPGARFVAEQVQYVVPDILVERNEDGDYDVRLLDDWLPNISISRRYWDLYKEKGGDKETKEYLKKRIQAAQWLQEAIEQRRSTLEKVTRAIVQHQRAFLDRGAEFIQPLKMQQIADQVGVHVTTVSRAVDDKWVQTPRGVFSLKRFFGGGTTSDTGQEVAWETIKQKLLEFINQEDKANPLSDEDLVAKFEAAGFTVARRTVTKYRKMLDIPSSRERKDWTG